MSQNENPKWIQYAVVIQQAVGQLLEQDNEFGFDPSELNEGQNLTEFFHALSNVVPANLYSSLCNQTTSYLDYNHLANKLCFQYSTKD